MIYKLALAVGFLILSWLLAPTGWNDSAIHLGAVSGLCVFAGIVGVLNFSNESPRRPVHWLGRSQAKVIIVLALYMMLWFTAAVDGAISWNSWIVFSKNNG